MIIMVPCYACTYRDIGMGWRTARQRAAAVVCPACNGTGQMRVEETLPCSACGLHGDPAGALVYQDTIGRLTVWRCAVGHVSTGDVGALTGEYR